MRVLEGEGKGRERRGRGARRAISGSIGGISGDQVK